MDSKGVVSHSHVLMMEAAYDRLDSMKHEVCDPFFEHTFRTFGDSPPDRIPIRDRIPQPIFSPELKADLSRLWPVFVAMRSASGEDGRSAFYRAVEVAEKHYQG